MAPPSSVRPNPDYSRLRSWLQQYGRPDVPDQRGAEDFVECENRESVQMLQNELLQLSEGRFEERIMDALLQKKRKAKYKSYQDWAKMMLLWIATAKKTSG